MADKKAEKDKSKVHKLSLKGSAKLVAEFVSRRISWAPDQYTDERPPCSSSTRSTPSSSNEASTRPRTLRP